MYRLQRISAVLGAAAALLLYTGTGPASASPAPVYDNIADGSVGNVPSLGYEATSTAEFGGQIQLAGTQRTGLELTVLMSSWGCESGTWTGGNCATTPGTTFSEPITMNVYDVNPDNSVGDLVTSMTQTFEIPYRPSSSPECVGGDSGLWWDGTDCYNGLATPITFDPTGAGVTWPDEIIVTLAYNTTHYGATPYGSDTDCYISDGGCGYDSLNVGLVGDDPTAGSQPTPDDAYLSSTSPGAYCDSGTGGTGELRYDAGCWTGYQPAFEVTPEAVAPTTADECKKGGWTHYTDPAFKNQGDCVSYTRHMG
jgi:hypothetical protein